MKLQNVNLYFNWKLPEEYKFFLKQYNGGFLFKIEDYAGFKFLSADELIKHNKFQKDNFGEDWDPEIILFCECIGDAEYLGLKLNRNEHVYIVYCIMDMLPKEWQVLEYSFDDFTNKLIAEKGKKFWLD